MKKPNITPGPWETDPESPYMIRIQNRDIYIANCAEASIGTESCLVNAQAISAVPEMLDDLVATYSLLKRMGGFAGKYDEDIGYGLESIKETLKKAGCTDENL